MKTDPDLDVVHDTFTYQILLGRDPAKTEDVKKILVAVAWYGPSPGAHGPVGGIDFKNNGKLEMWSLNIGDLVTREKYKGTYQVQGNKVFIEIQLESGKNAKHVGTLSKDGRLETPDMFTFTDDPDNCSA